MTFSPGFCFEFPITKHKLILNSTEIRRLKEALADNVSVDIFVIVHAVKVYNIIKKTETGRI